MRRTKPVEFLVVEDDQAMRSLLCDELQDLGACIVEARDGETALQLIRESPPTLILTDLRIPAGGLGYLARLRMAAPACPIILLTACGDSRTKTEAIQAGITAYFDKPVRMRDLTATIQMLLWGQSHS